jgi:hypothetical protein
MLDGRPRKRRNGEDGRIGLESAFSPLPGPLSNLSMHRYSPLSDSQLGYRHFDTANGYGNEAQVGKAIREGGVPREEIFLTTKLKCVPFPLTSRSRD